MPTSGIATLEVSVTMRMLACPPTPTPPPITMPSISATYGFGKRAICALSTYSSRKNLRAATPSILALSCTATTSPPAHRPRSPAPESTTTRTASSASHSARTAFIAAIMS
ncbi:Uncharacterised protein [Mycobacteroides abscessus subsp. abscessus]|nr:Uncharacterised protein [Mycobacteroides abscessus subsp. abscessus]